MLGLKAFDCSQGLFRTQKPEVRLVIHLMPTHIKSLKINYTKVYFFICIIKDSQDVVSYLVVYPTLAEIVTN